MERAERQPVNQTWPPGLARSGRRGLPCTRLVAPHWCALRTQPRPQLRDDSRRSPSPGRCARCWTGRARVEARRDRRRAAQRSGIGALRHRPHSGAVRGLRPMPLDPRGHWSWTSLCPGWAPHHARPVAHYPAPGDRNFLDVARLFGACRTFEKPFDLQHMLHAVQEELAASPSR
jgi:hypothetical protein